MRLFKEIDKYFTKKNAYEVLELYRRYARMAGEEHTPKLTATYSFGPKPSGFTNKATEIQVTNRVAACDELEEITKYKHSISEAEIFGLLDKVYKSGRRGLNTALIKKSDKVIDIIKPKEK